MTSHPDPAQLQAFVRRRLPPAVSLGVDTHLSHCEPCRRAAGRLAIGAPARSAVDAVIRHGAHLSFEQMQAYVDGTSTAARGLGVESHVALCPMCEAELRELEHFAPALRQAVDRPRAATAPRPWQRLLGSWGPTWAMAGLAGVAAIGLWVQAPEGRLGQPAGGPVELVGSARSGPALQLAPLERLESVSPPLAQAWQQRRYTELLPALRAQADKRHPWALAALGSLYAQGLGVRQDTATALQYWKRAADLGDTLARENLAALEREPSPNGR